MLLPDLVTVEPDDKHLLINLANMGGDSYLEELHVRELLSGLPEGSEGSDRERYLARALILNECIMAAPYQAVHCTHDGNGLIVAYQQSELNGTTWDQLMKDASANLIASVFSDEETDAYEAQLRRMETINVRDWVLREEAPGDFLQIALTAVDSDHRGTGNFRRMVEAVCAYADAAQLPVFCEVYSDALEEAFGAFGFREVHVFRDPKVSIYERCLRRDPTPQN
ncbi:hypothetical protein [uncultured Adlercreutzia sp.]|uniref:hypothetical protein n=1 Tax=uncultured Adlercreutzia sp. TaxID=875803 RepID=UPI0026F37F97|nr:hypothetical protein [uncultured Adlercreutzia sp.]